MSDTNNNRVLQERVKAIDTRLERVETDVKAQGERATELLVEIKVLKTRVSLYAAAMGAGAGLGVSVLRSMLQ